MQGSPVPFGLRDNVDVAPFPDPHDVLLVEPSDLGLVRISQDIVADSGAGTIRYIGFTGHKSPAIHLRMLETATKHGFRFDTVQMPLNVMARMKWPASGRV